MSNTSKSTIIVAMEGIKQSNNNQQVIRALQQKFKFEFKHGANLNRQAISVGTGQSQLNFGSTKKPEIINVEREVELRALKFEAELFIIEVLNKKESAEIGVQTQIDYVEELKEQQPFQKIKTYQCQDCQNIFSTKQSLKRDLKDVHSGKVKIYFKHEKVDGRYQCTTCMKPYTQSAKVKRHTQKHHLSEFLIEDQEIKKLAPAKRKPNTLEQQREQQEKHKKQKRFESMNQPVGNTISAYFQAKAMNIPALNVVNLSTCIENYLNINVPAKANGIVVDEYAYKVYPFSYLLKNQQYQNEFANEYMVLREAQRKDCKNLLMLDGVILNYGFIALRLKKFEMTLRDYHFHNRQPNDLNDILSEMIKGVKELHELGYVHRDLKSENVMLNLCPLQVVVIDFNRALRQEIVTLAQVLGTLGYFPIKEKWTNGSVYLNVWEVAAITLESNTESMSYFGTKHEKQSISLDQKHVKQEDICKEIKSIVEMIIVRAPNYLRQTLDDILDPLEKARSKDTIKITKQNFFELITLLLIKYSLNSHKIQILATNLNKTPTIPYKSKALINLTKGFWGFDYCTTCKKSYNHLANLKMHMQKHYLSESLIRDEKTLKLIPARKNNSLESQRHQEKRLEQEQF